MIDEAKLHELVPAVVGKFAMWSKNSGIMDPFLYTVALAENAHANGVDFFFDRKVTAITRENWMFEPDGIDQTLGELTRCGSQFHDILREITL